jgi:hypothetical protein
MMFGGGVCESVGIGICVDIGTSVISNHSIMAALYWHRYQIVMTDGFHVITGALDYIGMSVAERLLANGARLRSLTNSPSSLRGLHRQRNNSTPVNSEVLWLMCWCCIRGLRIFRRPEEVGEKRTAKILIEQYASCWTQYHPKKASCLV